MNHSPTSRRIAFDHVMVRSIESGAKTLTIRKLKTQPPAQDPFGNPTIPMHVEQTRKGEQAHFIYPDMMYTVSCPLGNPHDVLLVVEPWMITSSGKVEYRSLNESAGVMWRSPITMPRELSRISLEILQIRLQRLQEISEQDAMNDGIDKDCPIGHMPTYLAAPYSYALSLKWQKEWEANPWMWIVEFKMV